ncbi:MAG TPA: hypothetical protein VJY41_05820 [Prolixibacteraceae bacterium]|nr:hypothetical protein [Prolixibacteraceae bacterium]
MKKPKLSTEAIIGLVAAVVIVMVLIFAFKQKKEIKAIETHKQLEIAYIDSLQQLIKQTNTYYRDTLSVLDNEIAALKTEINNTRSKQVKYESYAKLDRMVSMSRFLIQENEALLIKLKNEPPKSEYTPEFLADLIEALIENIQIKEQRIIELEAEVQVLSEELRDQQILNKSIVSERDLANAERIKTEEEAKMKAMMLAQSEAEKEKLLVFQYILGSQKELLKDNILTKRLFKKECFMENNIPAERFTSIQLNKGKSKYFLGDIPDGEVYCAPALSGASFGIENGQLLLYISDLNQLVKNGRLVFYY